MTAITGIAGTSAGTPRTLYDKLWDEHVVHTEDDGTISQHTVCIDRDFVFNRCLRAKPTDHAT